MMAPDLPGFGVSDHPDRGLTFDQMAHRIDGFTQDR
jgi:hypothetical protein